LTLSLIEKIAAGPEQCFTDACPDRSRQIYLSTDSRRGKTTNN
jgi:hypothetical protein